MFLAAPDCIDLLIRIMTSGNNISLNYFSPMEVFVLQIKTAGHSDLFSLHRQKYLGICPAGTSRQRTPFHQVHCLVFLHIIHLWRTVLRLFYPAPADKFRLEFCNTEYKSRFWRFRHHFNRTLAVGSFRADVSVSADYPLADSFRYRFLPLPNRQTSTRHRWHFASGRPADTARHCQPANACRSNLCAF